MRDLRVVFLGMSSLFTLVPLRAVERRHRLVGIVEAAPPSQASSHTHAKEAGSTHLEQFARRRRLPHFVLERGGPSATEFLRSVRPDIMCVASFSRMLRPE